MSTHNTSRTRTSSTTFCRPEPAEDLSIHEGSDELYSAWQYGNLQKLHLSEHRAAEVRKALEDAGLSSALLQADEAET